MFKNIKIISPQSFKNFFYTRSIKEGIFYPLMFLFIFGFSISVIIIYFGGNYMLKRAAYNVLDSEKIRFFKLLNKERKILTQINLLLANDYQIRKFLYDKDRISLQKYVLYILNSLKTSGQVYSLSIKFYLKPDKLFLKIGKKKNILNKDTISKEVLNRIIKVHKRISGIEVDSSGLRLKSYFLVDGINLKSDKNYIGIIETSIELKELISNFPFNPDEGVILFLTPLSRKVLTSYLKSDLKVPYAATINLPIQFYSKLKKADFTENTQFKIDHYVVSTFKLLDFLGRDVVRVILVKNISLLVQQRNIALVALSFMFFIAFVVTLGVIWTGIDQVTSKLIILRESIKSLLKGDFSADLHPPLKINCWEFLGCDRKECSVFKEEKEICFLSAGDMAFSSESKNSCVFLEKFESCNRCPIFIKETRNELNGVIIWYHNLFKVLSGFFTKAIKSLNNMLDIVQDEMNETLMIRVEHILKEMTLLNSFRKTLETFVEKKEVYDYLRWFLKDHFGLNNFLIYEVNNSENRFELMVEEFSEVKNDISYDLLLDSNLCSVKRNGEPLNSIDYPQICSFSKIDNTRFFHYCFPIMMGGHVGAVVKFVISRASKEKFLRQVTFIKKYLDETAPILEAKRALEVTKQQALRDQLTGLYNRRFMEEYLNKWSFIIKRQTATASVLMLDLDHFKKINDRFGHHIGDLVLKRVAYIITSNLRASDLVFRYGGEEILVFLPNTSKKDAHNVAEKLRREIEIADFEALNTKFKVTVSIGVASCPEDDEDLKEVIKLSDKALYVAKQKGRNRVIVYNTLDLFS